MTGTLRTEGLFGRGCQYLSNTKGLELYNPQPCKEQ